MTQSIREKAELLARLELDLHWRAMSSVPSDPDERIRSDASYNLLMDAVAKARSDYNEAIRYMSAEELARLALGTGK